ncbi:MAG: prepilin-type N-terminal cleavage/methylation domain-containing protein [Candidatus Omnitrophica bacterium]|nr:prepilin-type N-terminal cleavage/methylation domain-containing protein [Candidatus Omnitrophota bacterium]MCM8802005.1 prepilin-type N-terminal cleavage/methylation domain-containing protein [Candidatus Omnitrophota bacterium]
MKKNKGFSLIEIIVSILIILIGVFGTLTYFFYSQINLNLERHKRTALQIAQSRIEFLKTVNYNNLENYIENGTNVNIDEITGKRITLIENIIDTEDGDNVPDYKKITVKVIWHENKRNNEVNLQTIIAPW